MFYFLSNAASSFQTCAPEGLFPMEVLLCVYSKERPNRGKFLVNLEFVERTDMDVYLPWMYYYYGTNYGRNAVWETGFSKLRFCYVNSCCFHLLLTWNWTYTFPPTKKSFCLWTECKQIYGKRELDNFVLPQGDEDFVLLLFPLKHHVHQYSSYSNPRGSCHQKDSVDGLRILNKNLDSALSCKNETTFSSDCWWLWLCQALGLLLLITVLGRCLAWWKWLIRLLRWATKAVRLYQPVSASLTL